MEPSSFHHMLVENSHPQAYWPEERMQEEKKSDTMEN